ncbi:MAG: YciI family protein [Enterobacterales bacterium]|nr:YciI family protein [Enterobacterales bacterium]
MQQYKPDQNFLASLLFYIILGSNVMAADSAANQYDPALASQLGADDYGMRSYVLVVLKTGPSVIKDKDKRNDIFRGHFANMKRLAAQKQLILAGPFMDAGDSRGLYIFNVETVEQAKKLVETDPAVAAGVFVAEYRKYYGSAALMKVNDIHKTIQKTKIE